MGNRYSSFRSIAGILTFAGWAVAVLSVIAVVLSFINESSGMIIAMCLGSVVGGFLLVAVGNFFELAINVANDINEMNHDKNK